MTGQNFGMISFCTGLPSQFRSSILGPRGYHTINTQLWEPNMTLDFFYLLKVVFAKNFKCANDLVKNGAQSRKEYEGSILWNASLLNDFIFAIREDLLLVSAQHAYKEQLLPLLRRIFCVFKFVNRMRD